MQTLEKRSADSLKFDIDCSSLLASTETISSVTSVTATPVTTTPLVFGTATVNTLAQTYTDAYGSTRTAAIGKVVQVNISGGLIATGTQV